MADATHDHLFKLCLGWVGYCKGIFVPCSAVFPCYCCSSYFSCFCYYDSSYSCCCWWCQVGGWLFLVIVLVLFLAHCFGLVSLLLFFLLWFVPFVLFFLGVFLLVLLLLACGYLKVARSPEMSLRERLLHVFKPFCRYRDFVFIHEAGRLQNHLLSCSKC